MQIISASIDLSKIDKTKIQTTDKSGQPFKNGGKFYNFDIIVNDDFDKFNNNVQLTDKQTKEERDAKTPKKFLGNGRRVWMSKPVEEKHDKGTTTRHGITTPDDDLPF